MTNQSVELSTPPSPAPRLEGTSVASRAGVLLRALLREQISLVAAIFLIVLLAACVSADLLVSAGLLPAPNDQNLLLRNSAPGFAREGSFRLLGTDQLGRDVLSRILVGARVSLSVGLATVICSGLIGVTIGLIAGFYRGRVDDLLMRLVDIQMGFPSLLLALIVLYTAGPGFQNLIIVLALTRWMVMARVTRAMALSVRESPYIEAARVVGASDGRLMLCHMLPNLLSPILVLATLEFARAMLSEAALSFLGVGIQPPESSWGLMLSQGREYITTAWWLVGFPGLAIFLTTLSVNLLSTWLRAVSDPVQRWRWLTG